MKHNSCLISRFNFSIYESIYTYQPPDMSCFRHTVGTKSQGQKTKAKEKNDGVLFLKGLYWDEKTINLGSNITHWLNQYIQGFLPEMVSAEKSNLAKQ